MVSVKTGSISVDAGSTVSVKAGFMVGSVTAGAGSVIVTVTRNIVTVSALSTRTEQIALKETVGNGRIKWKKIAMEALMPRASMPPSSKMVHDETRSLCRFRRHFSRY